MFRRFLATLAILAPLSVTQEAAPDRGSDLVLVIDLSSSMRKNDAFRHAIELFDGLITEVVRPGSQVAIVPFGEGVHDVVRFDVPTDDAGAGELRMRIHKTIEGFRARDSYSYLGAAVDAALEQLKQFKDARPDRGRHMVLVTDGPQFVSRGDPAPPLPEVLAKWAQKGMKAPDDAFLWYAYFGDPDADFATALERTGAGRSIPLDRLDELNWTFTRVAAKKADLGAKGGPSWNAFVPLVAKSGGGSAGRRLRISVGGTLPEGMTITASPREMVLVGRSTEIDVQLICTGAKSGFYDGVALLVEGDGFLHWAEPHRIPLHFRVGEPKLTVKEPKIDLGRIAPGGTVRGRIDLVPNEDAAASPPKIKFTTTGAPGGVKVSEAPADAKPGELSVGFKVEVPAEAKEGAVEAKLKLDAGDTMISAPEVRVAFQVAIPRITVGGTLNFEAAAGEDANAELKLALDTAVALPPDVRVAVKKGLPQGVTVDVPAVVAKGQGPLPVHVKVSGDVAPGEYKTALTFSAKGIRVEPAELALTVSVIRPPEPPQLTLPASLDLGDVPRSHAEELPGRFAVDLPPGFEGTDLVLESGDSGRVISDPVALREGSNDVVFRYRPTSLEAGEVVGFVRVLARRGRRAREAGMIALRWRITDANLAVKEVRKPEPLPFRGGTASAALTLEASEDLKGKAVTLALAFEKLPEGMEAKLASARAELTGGAQVVPVPFEVTGAHAGSYRGEIVLALESGIVLANAPVTLVVNPLTVSVHVDGSLEGLSQDDDRTITIVATVDEALIAPIDLTVSVDRDGLPEEVSLQTMETASLRRAGDVRVPVKLKVGANARSGTWHPRLSLAAAEGVVIQPSTVDLTVVVGEPKVVTASLAPSDSRKSLWSIVSLVALALTALTALYVGRSKDDMLIDTAPSR